MLLYYFANTGVIPVRPVLILGILLPSKDEADAPPFLFLRVCWDFVRRLDPPVCRRFWSRDLYLRLLRLWDDIYSINAYFFWTCDGFHPFAPGEW